MNHVVLNEKYRVSLKALFQQIMMKNRECHMASIKLTLIKALQLYKDKSPRYIQGIIK